MATMTEDLQLKMFDVAVVGGGVVGCAVLCEFTSLGLGCVLCEKEEDLVCGASSGNSGTLHTGFDAPLDSLELHCLQRARTLNENFFTQYGIPYKKTGGYIVAWTGEDLNKLPELVVKAQKAGVDDVRQVTGTELLNKEPWLNSNALGAVFVPGESIVDPWRIPIALAQTAIDHGATVLTSCHVIGGQKEKDHWFLSTSKGSITAKVIVNCAGLHGDKLETIHRKSPFTIKPRKGQYAVFSKSAGGLLNSIIFPVPNPKTKGILVFPTVHGNVLVGPTAEDQWNCTKAEIDKTVINNLVKHACFVLPVLKDHEVIGTYAGLRPATEFKDYCVDCQPEERWITVGGIRSTGLSACLGIAKHVSSYLPSLGFHGFHRQGANTPHTVEKYNGDGYLKVNGRKWKITHPITKFGLADDNVTVSE